MREFLVRKALASLGRDREAIGWYAGRGWSFFSPSGYFWRRRIWRKAKVNERLGEPERAGYHYGRFIARWENADSIQQPLVRDVRRGWLERRGSREAEGRIVTTPYLRSTRHDSVSFFMSNVWIALLTTPRGAI